MSVGLKLRVVSLCGVRNVSSKAECQVTGHLSVGQGLARSAVPVCSGVMTRKHLRMANKDTGFESSPQ